MDYVSKVHWRIHEWYILMGIKMRVNICRKPYKIFKRSASIANSDKPIWFMLLL